MIYQAVRMAQAAGRSAERAQKAELARLEDPRPVALRQDVQIRPVELARHDVQMNSALLLDAVYGFFSVYGRWPGEEELVTAVLWAASTHFADREGNLLFKAHGRLFFIGPMGSGKTQLMSVIGSVVRDWTGVADGVVTSYGIRDALNQNQTITLDEVDRLFITGRANMNIQRLVAAYKADSISLNGREGGNNKQSNFGAMMLGAKPRIMDGTGDNLNDLFERSLIITPRRSRDKIPRMDGTFEEMSGKLRAGLSLWGEAERPDNPDEKLWPIHEVPDRLAGRQLEIAEPLLAVADRAVNPAVIARNGSDTRWAQRGRDAVEKILLDRGGNADEIIADVRRQLRKMGIKL